MALPTVDCFLGIPPDERWKAMYEALLDIQSATGGGSGSFVMSEKQYATVSNDTIGTANGDVFTLVDGEIGFIQNLDVTQLYVRLGTGASATDVNFILAAGTAADDGLGHSVFIKSFIGTVSVFGTTPRYIAWKLS